MKMFFKCDCGSKNCPKEIEVDSEILITDKKISVSINIEKLRGDYAYKKELLHALTMVSMKEQSLREQFDIVAVKGLYNRLCEKIQIEIPNSSGYIKGDLANA